MKNLLILSAFIFACIFANAQTANSGSTKMKFNKLEHDFGNQPQGKPVTYEFEFTNESNEPIVLENVKASCGCTTPTWTKEPVMPKKIGTIKAQYNMARDGAFRKSITVTTKDGENVTLYISGNAVAQKQGVDDAEPTLLNGQ